MSDYMVEKARRANEANQASGRSAVLAMVLILVAGTLLSLVLGFWLASDIVTPLVAGTDLMETLAKGDLRPRLQLRRGD